MKRQPNVLLILADDMGYGDFGIYNEGLSQTPALDRLAAEGLVLSQHYSASPVCAPARAALLTGRYPQRTGVIDTYELLGLDRLALDEVTLADVFKSAGYRTGLVGKWHCGALSPDHHPNRRGFDEFVGFRGGWMDYFAWTLERNGSRLSCDGRYLTDVLSDEAIAFVRRNRTVPFFLHLAYNAPHFPIQAPEEEVKPFLDAGRFTLGVSTLYGMIRAMDRGIGRVLAELDHQGLAGQTVVLFSSDNGPDFGGEGQMSLRRFNGGLRGRKTLVYEGGIRVPLILRWPGEIDAPAESEELVHFTDWFPTLLAMCGLSPPSGLALDGEDVWPLLREGVKRGRSPREAPKRFWQWNRFTPFATCNAAAREGDWKLVRPPVEAVMPESDPQRVIESDRELKYSPGSHTAIRPEWIPATSAPEALVPQLFNLARDPFEEEDLAAEEPARVKGMLEALEGWFEDVEAERKRTRPRVEP